MPRTLFTILLCAGIWSCDPRLPSSTDVAVDFEAIDAPTTPLSEGGKSAMAGIYQVVQGEGILGNPVVGKWIGNRWCLLAQHDVVFSISAGGSSGDSIKLWGYVRYVRSGSGVRWRLKVSAENGARQILSGSIPPILTITGTTDDGSAIELRRTGGIRPSNFHRLAHRGGGRNSDRLGISENSIPMIQYAASLGATGVELDVKRTRDGELILFHDNTFSPRTVQGTYLLGNVEMFDMDQIRALGKLVNGEEIPTLRQALKVVIDETPLSLVWLDIKDPLAVSQVVRIQQEMAAYAAARGRDTVTMLLGIPTEEVLNAYIPYKDSSDALMELELERALQLPRCKVWAPAWTRDITEADVARARASGRKVFTWTVDLRESIAGYLARIDGILSNYPSLVCALNDSRD